MAYSILTYHSWSSANFTGARLLVQSDQPLPDNLDEMTLDDLGLNLPGMFLADVANAGPGKLELLTLEAQ